MQQKMFDGVLIDVSEMAKELGFTVPVAVTSAVWEQYINPDQRSAEHGQSIEGRLWDTLHMLRCAARTAEKWQSTIRFEVCFVQRARQRRFVELKAFFGPGAITVMLSDED